MNNLNLLLIFTGIILFLWIRYRKNFKRQQPVLREKQILIRGTQLITPLHVKTPLVCLLEEGRKFGEDFKDKEPPSLPHTEGCQCSLVNYETRSREWFDRNGKDEREFESDLGGLTEKEKRYYRFALILNKSDQLENEEKEKYAECLDRINISSQFKKRVEEHLLTLRNDDQESLPHHSKSSEEPQ